MLIEYAGDILPSLATAVGGPTFAPYFAGFLPLLLKKTVRKVSHIQFTQRFLWVVTQFFQGRIVERHKRTSV